MTTLKALIVDDELNNRENLKLALEQYCPSVEVIGLAEGVLAALKMIHAQKPDLVFLDIEMPNGSGFDLLESLPQIDFEVIFVTAYDQYAIRAIKFAAVDYLLKPLDIEELQMAVNKVIDRAGNKESQAQNLEVLRQNMQEQPQKLGLPQSDGIDFIEIQDIVRCQSERNYTHFFLKSGKKLLVSKNLGEYVQMLEDQGFYRIHQSHLINLKEVDRLVKKDGGYLLMSDQSQIPIARNRKEGLMAELMK